MSNPTRGQPRRHAGVGAGSRSRSPTGWRASAGTRPSHGRSRRSTSRRRSRWRPARRCVLVLAQTGFATGTHELYQLPLCFISPDELGASVSRSSAATAGSSSMPSPTPSWAASCCARSTTSARSTPTRAARGFVRVGSGGPLRHDAAVRPMGVEQSNSSIVFADETVLKVFRRLEPGINPELEMLRFLTEHEFESIAPLQGWYEYEGRSLPATLGRRAAVHARRGRRLGARARPDRHRPGRVPDLARARSAG